MADTPITSGRAWPSVLIRARSGFGSRSDVTALDIDQRMLRVVQVATGKTPGSTRVKRVEVIPVPGEEFDLANPKKSASGSPCNSSHCTSHLAPWSWPHAGAKPC